MDTSIILIAIFLGVTSSLHCVGMCGPIALSLGLESKNKISFIIKNLTYQFGRITTYSIFGSLSGLIGESFSLAGLQNYFSIFVGILMILMFIIPKFYESGVLHIKPIDVFMVKLKVILGKFLLRKKSSLYIIGFLNGLLPCAMVYTSLTIATGLSSIKSSVLFMFFFGIGTLPLMFATALFGNFLSINQRQLILKILPIITLVLGILFILRGLQLNVPFVSPARDLLKLNNLDSRCI